MKVRDLIKLLQKHRPDSYVTFSVELPESEDPTERRFAEDGWQFVQGNGSVQLNCRDETKITIGVLCGPSNLASGIGTGDAGKIPLNDDTRRILGTVCIQCIHLAELLRSDGHAIDRKAEAEQAAVIHWMLNIYLEHGEKWRDVVEQEAKRMHLAQKTRRENELAQSEKSES
jgi:hypothetical protein